MGLRLHRPVECDGNDYVFWGWFRKRRHVFVLFGGTFMFANITLHVTFQGYHAVRELKPHVKGMWKPSAHLQVCSPKLVVILVHTPRHMTKYAFRWFQLPAITPSQLSPQTQEQTQTMSCPKQPRESISLIKWLLWTATFGTSLWPSSHKEKPW